MSEKERLETELAKAERELARSERFANDHKDRGHKKQAQLAKEFVDRDSEKVYRLRRQLGKER